jgi:hypothetical protein
MTDEELAKLKANIAGSPDNGWYLDEAHHVFEEIIDELIAARARIKELEAIIHEEFGVTEGQKTSRVWDKFRITEADVTEARRAQRRLKEREEDPK